jgi:hypothetical protein
MMKMNLWCCRLQGRLFCCLISIFLCVSVARAYSGPTLTTVNDVVYRADGSTATGTLVISWDAFTTADGKAVPAGQMSATLSSTGALNVALAPNEGATPSGSYYEVVYKLDDGTTSTEYWTVPATSPTTIAAIRAVVEPKQVAVAVQGNPNALVKNPTDTQTISGPYDLVLGGALKPAAPGQSLGATGAEWNATLGSVTAQGISATGTVSANLLSANSIGMNGAKIAPNPLAAGSGHLVLYPDFPGNNSAFSLVPHTPITPGAQGGSALFELFATDWMADQSNFEDLQIKAQDSGNGSGMVYSIATDAGGTGQHRPIVFQQSGANVALLSSTGFGGAGRMMINQANLTDFATTPLEVNGDFSLKTRGNKIILGLGSSGTEWITNDAATGDIVFFANAGEKFRIMQGGGIKAKQFMAITDTGDSTPARPIKQQFGNINFRNASDTAAVAQISDTGLGTFLGGMNIGGGTTITKHLSAAATLDFSSWTGGSCQDRTISVSGAADGDTVTVGVPSVLASVAGLQFSGFVSAANTVTVRGCKITSGASADPAPAPVRADVWQH